MHNDLILGYIMLMEVKSNQKAYQRSQKQLFDGKESIQNAFSAQGKKTAFKYVGVFFAQDGVGKPLFDCEKCSVFTIIGTENFPEKMKSIEKEVALSNENWKPSEHVDEFIKVAKEILFITQGKQRTFAAKICPKLSACCNGLEF